MSKILENVSAQLCSFMQKIIFMKNFSQDSGLHHSTYTELLTKVAS